MTAIEAFTVLDHYENITVPGPVFQQPTNEYAALLTLRTGLEFLHRQALRADDTVRQTVNPKGELKYFGMGNLPELSQVPIPLLVCAFHWYAISACQYVRLVGAIAYRQDNSRKLPPHYVQAVIPEVLAFRNKVAAHFAFSTENSKDNEAERLASILPPLAFVNDSFHVGAMTVGLSHDGKDSNSSTIAPWSICEVHERLKARYWPEVK
jgi:hypothetical protein